MNRDFDLIAFDIKSPPNFKEAQESSNNELKNDSPKIYDLAKEKKRKKSTDKQASNTHYGTKFYEFRNTLQNFNNKSNKALNNIMQ